MNFVGDRRLTELGFAQTVENRTSFTLLKVSGDSLKIYSENNGEF